MYHLPHLELTVNEKERTTGKPATIYLSTKGLLDFGEKVAGIVEYLVDILTKNIFMLIGRL